MVSWRGALGLAAAPLAVRAVICEHRAGIGRSLDATPCVSIYLRSNTPAAAPALAATGLRLIEWLSGLIRRDGRRDIVFVFSNPFKGPRGEI